MITPVDGLLLISLLLLTWSNVTMWSDVRSNTVPTEKEIRKKVEKMTREVFYHTYEQVDHNLGAESLGKLVQLINKSQLKVNK